MESAPQNLLAQHKLLFVSLKILSQIHDTNRVLIALVLEWIAVRISVPHFSFFVLHFPGVYQIGEQPRGSDSLTFKPVGEASSSHI